MGVSDSSLRELYLDLIQKVIINEIYADPPLKRSIVGKLLAKVGIYTRHEATREFDHSKRELGLDWPSIAHSMIGSKRMSNLRNLLVDVIENEVEGDFIETGVWRGGACIYAKAIMKSYGITNRKVWLADSFSGLPKSDGTKYEADKGDLHSKEEALSVSREEVENNFNAFSGNFIDDACCFHLFRLQIDSSLSTNGMPRTLPPTNNTYVFIRVDGGNSVAQYNAISSSKSSPTSQIIKCLALMSLS